MKDLEKMIMGGGAPKAESGGSMSKTDFQAKLDVVQELIQSMQEAMGGQVKGGMEELMAAMQPEAVEEVMASPSVSPQEASEMPEQEPEEPMVESSSDEEIEPKALEDDEDDSLFGKKKNKSKFY